MHVFPVLFLFIDTIGNVTFPRTKTVKSVGHFLKTPFPVGAHKLRQVCPQVADLSPSSRHVFVSVRDGMGHKADRLDRLKASQPFHQDQWPFYHKRHVRCRFFFFFFNFLIRLKLDSG